VCDAKNDPIGLPEAEVDKKSDSNTHSDSYYC